MISPIARAAATALVLAALPPLALAQTGNGGQGAPAKGASEQDPIVATVDGAPIHRSEVEAAREDLPPQYQSFPFEVVFPALVERLIDSKLVAEEGRKEGLAKDPEVKQRMAQLEDQVIQSVYLTRAVKGKISDEMLKKKYDEYVKANPPETEVHARHILVKTEDEAKGIIKDLKGGADFATLAKKKSSGPSAAQGGDLGYIKRADVVPEFAEAAFALKPGQYTTTPVKTQFGWHIIKVEDVRTSQPPKFDEVKDQLEREASRDVITGVVNDLREHAKIVRFNPDGSPKTEGGEQPDSGQPSGGGQGGSAKPAK
ncbi:MAG TPA: peptidylprolyl isomerase [Alphaproteobacteria bacterium]|nr:peptidylprolyl isomerase [Alphaproteobacteria bacterium]